jgi:folylpolyglutamate synthase/dihydropteroate synthase
MGVMADKDVQAMVRALASSASLAGAKVIATTLPDVPRSKPSAELAEIWRRSAPVVGAVSTEHDPASALHTAMQSSSSLTVVAGSLYLVGAIRALLVDDPDLRDPDPLDRPAPGTPR